MNRRNLGLVLLVLSSSLLWSDRASGMQNARSSTAPSTALQEAIRVLTEEAEAQLKDPSAMPRGKSNYFAPGQGGVSEVELLEAMSKRISRNNFVDAYVKWQLTSGLPAKISEANVRLAARAYRGAPGLQRLPGTHPQEQQQLEQAIQGAKETDISTINGKWRERVDPVVRHNDMLIRYRDALFVRLPLSPEVIELALGDAIQRTEAGMDAKDFVNSLILLVRGWAIEGASPAQLNRVANMFARLRDQQGVTVFSKVQWDDYKNTVVWKKETRRVNPDYSSKSPDSDAFVALVAELQGIAKNPSGGLRLKDK